jgi:hypothetical protein
VRAALAVRRGWWAFLFGCALLAAGGGSALAAAFVVAAVPDWVEPIAKLPEVGEDGRSGDGSSYLLRDEQYHLGGGTVQNYFRVAYRLDTRASLESGGTFGIGFQPDYQQLRLHAVGIVRDGRLEDRTREVRTELLRREKRLEDGLLDGWHTLNVLIPDVRTGDIVDYAYTIVGFNPVFDGGFHLLQSAHFGVPLALRRLRVLHPRELALHWQVDAPGYRTEVFDRGGLTGLDLVAEQLPRRAVEDKEPDWYDPFGRLELSTAADWQAVAAWAKPRLALGFTDRGVAAALVDELGLVGDPLEVLAKAVAFVQDEIRYTGLSVGEWTHAAYPPEETLQRRYGDCKDKSVLLLALLAEAGIAARPVLVSTSWRQALAARLPSPYAFDHVVVQVLLGEREVWIDATRRREHGAFDRRTPLDFRLGLPVADGVDRLVEIPRHPLPFPDIDVVQRIDVSGEGADAMAAFTIASTYAGVEAERVLARFAADGAGQVGKEYLGYMGRYYPGIAADGMPTIAPRDQDGRVRVDERYRWPMPDSELAAILFQIDDWIPADPAPRDAPLALSGPRHVRQQIEVRIDGRWSIDVEEHSVASPWFRFDRSVRSDGQVLHLRGDWHRLDDAIAVDALDAARDSIAEAQALVDFGLDLDPPRWSWQPAALAWPGGALSCALLVGVVGWRRRRRDPLSGMLYRPADTIEALLQRTDPMAGVLLLLLASAALGMAWEQGAEFALDGSARNAGAMLGGIVGGVMKSLVAVALALLGFRLLRRPARYDSLLVAYAWSMLPWIALGLCALVAVRFRLQLFAGASVPDADDLPAIFLAFGLVIVGVGWTLYAMVSAYGRVTDSSRRRSLAAIALGVLVLAVPLVSLLMLFK